MRHDLPIPDIREEDEDEKLKEQLLLAARRGWHCPRPTVIMDRIKAFIDPVHDDYDEQFAERILQTNSNWFYDLGFDPGTGRKSTGLS